ncbi:hypothetical protein ACR03S_06580 [Limimaricola variabilis]
MQPRDQQQQPADSPAEDASATHAALLALARLMGRLAAQDHVAASSQDMDGSHAQNTRP